MSKKQRCSEKLFLNILENTPAIIAFHDRNQKILWANKAYREAAGLTLEQIVGMKCYVAWGLKEPCQGCPVTVALKTKEAAEGEMTPENQPHWPKTQGYWLVKASPLLDEGGEIIGVIEVAFDIGKRIVEEQLRLSEEKEKFYVIAENALDAIILINEEGNVEYLNPAAERMFGYSASELMGKDVHALLMPEEYREQFEKGFDEFRKTHTGPAVGKVLELTAKRKSGATFPIEIAVSPLKMKDKFWAVAIIRDISERKKIEEKIAQQIKLLSDLYKSAQKLTEALGLSERAKEVVRSSVELLGVDFAWLGYAQKDGSVRLLAHYPEELSYPLDITVRWDET